MKKYIISGLFILLLLTGCANEVAINTSNEIDSEKNNYLAYKNELKEQKEFTNQDDLPCNITSSIDRINEEEISYRVILDNPKEDMYQIKALVIHDYFTEDIFPSIGIFDKTSELLLDNQDVKGIQLVGYIKTTKSIEDINLELRVWISYQDKDGQNKEVYYKPTI